VTGELPWPFAGRVAGLLAGSHPLSGSYLLEHLAIELPDVVRRANELVAAETGLDLPGDPTVAVVDRRQWIERNIASFTHLLEPAERRLAERFERIGADDVGETLARRLVAAETGALLGFLSRRVLGQYELVLPSGQDADTVAFVGVNVLAMERGHQLRPSDFRLWIALHEAAHRAQFVGVPWMRPHFLSLVEEMLEHVEPEEGRLRRILADALRARREGRPLVDERGLLGMFASAAQRGTLDRIQALMSLLEGHGHVVMDRIGAREIPSQGRMSSLLKARRSDPRTAAFFRLTGLEMKFRQYEMGERFVVGVEKEAGWDALAAAWTSADALPTLEEIGDPARWLRRVA
jgi:coenzyme F420 biosynthesis associated uncharacterized protein